MDETFEDGGQPDGRLFARNELGKWTTEARRKVQAAITKATDDAVLEADADGWAAGLADEHQFEPVEFWSSSAARSAAFPPATVALHALRGDTPERGARERQRRFG